MGGSLNSSNNIWREEGMKSVKIKCSYCGSLIEELLLDRWDFNEGDIALCCMENIECVKKHLEVLTISDNVSDEDFALLKSKIIELENENTK